MGERMSGKAKVVIELLDDSDGDTDEKDDTIEAVVGPVGPIQPIPQAATARSDGHGRRKHKNGGVDSFLDDRRDDKRIKTGCLKDDTANKCATDNVCTIVRIDNDGMDDAVVTPGVLRPMHEWIYSGKTSDIVQFVRQKDKWSCGFRNLQMSLSAVLPHLPPDHMFFQKFPHRQDHVSLPSLRQTQRALEEAWKAGFDPRGARHFRQKLVGKHSWIGAVEVSSVLSYWGVDSVVVQFIRCRESREQLPRYVRAYFSKCLGKESCPFCTRGGGSGDGGSGAIRATQCAEHLLQFSSTCGDGLQTEEECKCPVLPIYLQWQGHSVTVVGMDGKDEFLVFDPLKQKVPSRLPVGKVITKDTQVVMLTSFRSLSLKEQQMRKGEDEASFVATAANEVVQRTMTI